jgi:hypothetical protein
LSKRVAAVEENVQHRAENGPKMTFRDETVIEKPVALGDQIFDVPHDADLSQIPSPLNRGGEIVCEGKSIIKAPMAGGRQVFFGKK